MNRRLPRNFDGTIVPPNWRTLSLGALWDRLNEPRRLTTLAVIEAVMYCVRARGLAALQEPANIERLARCDPAARQQMNERIERLLKKEMAA